MAATAYPSVKRPVLLGDGVRRYGEPASRGAELEPVGSRPVGRQTDLRFRVRR